MKVSAIFSACLSLLLLVGCGDDTSPTTDVGSDIPMPTQAPDVPGSCCFTELTQFEQFFPPVTDDFYVKTEGVSGNLLCMDDPENASSASKSYYNRDGIRFKVQMKDYCAQQPSDFSHLADPDTDPSITEMPGAFEMLNDGGLYTGYAKYWQQDPNLNNGNPAHVKAIVDGRFYISIQALEQTGLEDVMALFNSMPLAELAAFGK